MKYLFVILACLALSCSKKNDGPCYDCTAISAGTTYNEVVCTDGQPEDKLPDSDANGNLNWTCHKR